jgi:ATPase subunit of ABC transporter with duplicated ATPase domains
LLASHCILCHNNGDYDDDDIDYRNDIEIPNQLGSAFLNALDNSNRERAAAIMSFEERVLTERKQIKQAISDNPIVIRAQELMKKVKGKEFDFSVRIKDGYFKYVERIDETQAAKSTKRQIETVYNGAPSQGLIQKLIRTMKGDFSGKKVVEQYPMKNINLYFEQGKTYLVLGAPRSGKSSLLKMLAGILPEDKDHVVGGEVAVNTITPKTEGVVWPNVVGYIDQIERLHPYLTVKETCDVSIIIFYLFYTPSLLSPLFIFHSFNLISSVLFRIVYETKVCLEVSLGRNS